MVHNRRAVNRTFGWIGSIVLSLVALVYELRRGYYLKDLHARFRKAMSN